jgi:hypothetical protein
MQLVTLVFIVSSLKAASFEESASGFLKKHCLSCHGNSIAPAGKLNLARFSSEAHVEADLKIWAKVLDLVEAEQMPPATMKKPAQGERAQFTGWLQALIDKPTGKPKAGPPVNRRLTRLEFNNSVRDLLGLNGDLFAFPERLPYTKTYFKPSGRRFPKAVDVDTIEYGQPMPVMLRNSSLLGEGRAEYGFTNFSSNLNISPILMERYLAMAREIAEHSDLSRESSIVRLLFSASTRTSLGARFQPFLEAAFRRPVDIAELNRYLQAYDRQRQAGQSHEVGVRTAIRAVLSSPAFLLRIEQGEASGAVKDWDLASRLSYFLWASAPDAELRELARSGQLRDSVIRNKQVERMLVDPRIRELSESFAIQWLQLNEMLGSQPDVERFKHFYIFDAFGTNKGNLGMDMITESLLLFETILTEDRSVIDFIDPGFTYWNSRLIRHNKLEGVYVKEMKEAAQFGTRKGPSRFFRLNLPDRNRGGILTMGAALTMNSTPMRTSPVFRGAWVLEAVFNRPPPPPPNNVAPLEAQGGDDSVLSVRQKLAEHRKNPACASCHARMDPLGFALENFDAVGVWRDKDGSAAIDASGELSHGRRFDSPGGLKKAILERQEDFVRGFVEHMLSYALNRKLDYADAPAVRSIIESAAKDQYRFSAIVRGVVDSHPFLNLDPVEVKTLNPILEQKR